MRSNVDRDRSILGETDRFGVFFRHQTSPARATTAARSTRCRRCRGLSRHRNAAVPSHLVLQQPCAFTLAADRRKKNTLNGRGKNGNAQDHMYVINGEKEREIKRSNDVITHVIRKDEREEAEKTTMTTIIKITNTARRENTSWSRERLRLRTLHVSVNVSIPVDFYASQLPRR